MSAPQPSPRTPPGRVSWNDLLSPDPAAATAFYEALFGWRAAAYRPSVPVENLPPYTLFHAGPEDADAAGLLPAPDPGSPAQWVPYFVVTDLEAALTTALSHGATALGPVRNLGRVGRIALIRDPQGALLGLHELAPRRP